MKQTDNYKLNKPESEDYFNIVDFNDNADILDSALTEINKSKQNNITGAISNLTDKNLKNGMVLVSDIAGKIVTSQISAANLNCMMNIRNNIQNQIDGKSEKTHSHTVKDVVGFTPVQQSGGTGQLDNKIYIGWSGTQLKAQVDNTDMGAVITDGAANGAMLPVSKMAGTVPISKGGTGATTANKALNAITEIKKIDLADFGELINAKSVNGTVVKIGNRINAQLIVSELMSSANCSQQFFIIKSNYRPSKNAFGTASIGIVNGYADDGKKKSVITGYINANNQSNGIITAVFTEASKTYNYAYVFLDYYCG